MCAQARVPLPLVPGQPPQAVQITPRYDQVAPSWLGDHANISLVWHRCLPAHDKVPHPAQATPLGVSFAAEWAAAHVQPNAAAQRRDERKVRMQADEWHGLGVLEWFSNAVERHRDSTLVRAAHLRRADVLDGIGAKRYRVATLWRLAIGLGNPATVENSGITVHHIYGFPVIAGASLKGLARHFLEQEVPCRIGGGPRFSWERKVNWRQLLDDAGYRTVEHASYEMFGGATAGPEQADERTAGDGTRCEGALAFHDAWAAGTRWFEPDVLTSHHSKYYGSDAGRPAMPDDREGPNPVHFLTVRMKVSFEFGIGFTSQGKSTEARAGRPDGLDAPTTEAIRRLAAVLVREAMSDWGVGAKTGSGYGRMTSLGPLSIL